MVTLKSEFNNFLRDHFNGLEIRKPLYLKYPNALRFDLQNDGEIDEQYFTEVLLRAKTLYDAAFDLNDEVYLVLYSYKYKRRKIRAGSFCFKQISHLNPEEISYSLIRRMYEWEDWNDLYNIALLKRKVKDINYSNILTAIANTDFPPRQPRLDNNRKELYFVNIKRKLIFHMYDDRGLDILASDIGTLRPIFIKYNKWILEYDRERIESSFNLF